MQHIGDLLHKQMTRKQFLQTLGMLILTAVGISAFLRYAAPDQKAKNPLKYGQ